MDAIRAAADAIVVGAGTIRAEDPPIRIRRRAHRDARKTGGKPAHPVAVILSRSLELPLDGRFFQDTRVEKLVVTTEDAPPDRMDRIRPLAELWQIGSGDVDIQALCAALRRRGIERLLVEGGGEVNRAFLHAGCVDEIYTTLCPLIIGGRDAPTPVDGEGFGPARFPALRLLSVERVDDELYLRYRVAGTREIRSSDD